MKNIKSTNLIILFFLIFLSLILSFYIAFNFPIIETQPVYYEIAKSLMNSDYIIDNEKHVKNFYTFGYPAFISGYFFNNSVRNSGCLENEREVTATLPSYFLIF